MFVKCPHNILLGVHSRKIIDSHTLVDSEKRANDNKHRQLYLLHNFHSAKHQDWQSHECRNAQRKSGLAFMRAILQKLFILDNAEQMTNLISLQLVLGNWIAAICSRRVSSTWIFNSRSRQCKTAPRTKVKFRNIAKQYFERLFLLIFALYKQMTWFLTQDVTVNANSCAVDSHQGTLQYQWLCKIRSVSKVYTKTLT